MPIDLTGVWHCDDDGGTYYIRQDGPTVVWAGLHDSGFHMGIEFANVFWGTLGADGLSVSGEWVDVPRGGAESSGILRFTIADDVFRELFQDPKQTTGGFGGKHWSKTDDHLTPNDIVEIANAVYRADNMLGQNNPPCRDFTVMWGYTEAYDALAADPKTHDQVRPGLSGPDLPPDPSYCYCSFVQSARVFLSDLGRGWGGDADFTFNLDPDWNLTDPRGQFWTTGWVPTMFGAKTSSQFIHDLVNQWNFFHCECMMYGRTNSDDDNDCKAPARVVLPGWNESSGNSILVNGRPIEGHVTPSDSNAEHDFISFGIGPNGASVNLVIPQQVRVTGVVADDAGHAAGQPPEIHPVYQIDIITDDFKKGSSQTLSGAWHGVGDSGTYYIRQLGNDIWWLGLSRDQGRTFANVFKGTLNNTTGVIEGEWIDIPMGLGGFLGGGTLSMKGVRAFGQGPGPYEGAHEIDKVSNPAVFGANSWLKLYDAPGQPAPSRGDIAHPVSGGPNQLRP
jgi:hypothetical protein